MKTFKAYIRVSKKYIVNAVLNGELNLKRGSLFATCNGQSYELTDYLHCEHTVLLFQDISLNDIQTKFHNPTWDGNRIWFDVEAEVLNAYLSDMCRDIRRLSKFADKDLIYKHDIKRTIDALNNLL